jgi:hypothetical protein
VTRKTGAQARLRVAIVAAAPKIAFKGRPIRQDDAMSGEKPTDAAQADPAMVPGELGDLLRQIEKEPVPERLLELALKLQVALARRRAAETVREPAQAGA